MGRIGTLDVNLPPVATSFVGREDELAELAELLGHERLVMLTGAGGSGKTRLALAVAHDQARRFPDGVHFVDLASARGGADVSTALARAVGIPGNNAEQLRHEILAALGARRALLVLDNCEHVVESTAELADQLVERCPSVSLLATSREPLEAAGERVYPVGPLSAVSAASPAVSLFTARARALRPDFAPDDATLGVITDICRRLDGLPLAIELAAARVAHLTPNDILTRVEDRFRLLSGARRRVDRHRSLQAAMDWSYDLLDEANRVLFRRLAAFRGSFTLDATEGVCAGGPVPVEEVLDDLASLVAKSLVIADVQGDKTRYRLLETVRDYAAERLAAGEEGEIRARHRDWYLTWAEAVSMGLPTMSDTVAECLDPDWENLRAALDWSLEHGELEQLARLATALVALWRTTTRVAEAPRWLEPIAGAADRFPPHLRVATLLLAANAALVHLDPSAAELARRATAADGPMSPWLAEAWALRAIVEGVLDPGGPAADESIARALVATETGLTGLQAAHVRMGVGLALITCGRLEEAAEQLEMALVVLAPARTAFRHSNLIVRTALAPLYHVAGDHAQARWVIQPVLDDLDERGWRRLPIAGIGPVAAVLAGVGEIERARALVRRDIHETRDALAVARSDDLLGLAIVAGCEGDWEKASRLLAASVKSGEAELSAFRTPPSGLLYRHYVTLARDRLGSERASRCRAEGREMTAADAFEYGLAEAPTSEAPVFERHGDVWALTYRGERAHLKDSKGIGDLARLIATPGQPASSIDLAGLRPAGAANQIPTVDPGVQEVIRARIAELDAAVDDAEEAADTERAARARAERDTALERLATQLGICGRLRSPTEEAESARKTVSTRIRDAIRRIDAVHADLADHLRATVRTGRECVYGPAGSPSRNG